LLVPVAQLAWFSSGDCILRLTPPNSVQPLPNSMTSSFHSSSPMQSFNPDAAFIKNAQAASVMSNVPRAPPKCGRPKIQKLEMYGLKRKCGRPPGTGHKQKARELYGEGGNGASEASRRPRGKGRPRKEVVPSSISIQFGKVVSHAGLSIETSCLSLTRLYLARICACDQQPWHHRTSFHHQFPLRMIVKLSPFHHLPPCLASTMLLQQTQHRLQPLWMAWVFCNQIPVCIHRLYLMKIRSTQLRLLTTTKMELGRGLLRRMRNKMTAMKLRMNQCVWMVHQTLDLANGDCCLLGYLCHSRPRLRNRNSVTPMDYHLYTHTIKPSGFPRS